MNRTLRTAGAARTAFGLKHLSFPAALLTVGLLSTFPVESYAITCALTTECQIFTQEDGNLTRETITAKLATLEATISGAILDLKLTMQNLLGASSATNASAATTAATASGIDAQTLSSANKKDTIAATATQMTCNNASGTTVSRLGGGGGGVNGANSNLDEKTKSAVAAACVGDKCVLPSKDSDQTRGDIGEGYCKDFAAAGTPRGDLCTMIEAPPQNKTVYLEADTKATTLFDGPQIPGAVVTNLSTLLAAGTPERDARTAYLTLLNNAQPLATPPKDAMASIDSSVYMGLRTEYENAKNLAAYPSMEFDRLSTINPKTLAAIKAIGTDDSPFLSRYFSGVDPKFYQEGVSALTLMDIEVEKRVGNIDWFLRMAGSDPSVVAKEMMLMQAQSMRVANIQLQQTLKTNVLLGKLLNISIENTYRPALDKSSRELLEKAQRQAAKQVSAGGAPASAGATAAP